MKVRGLKKTNEQLLERKKRFFSPYQRLRDAQIKKAKEQNKGQIHENCAKYPEEDSRTQEK